MSTIDQIFNPDQAEPITDGNVFISGDADNEKQTFTVGRNGTLTQIDLIIEDANSGSTELVDFVLRNANTGEELETQTINSNQINTSLENDWTTVMDDINLRVSSGDKLSIQVITPDEIWWRQAFSDTEDLYSGGEHISSSSSNIDAAFRTFVEQGQGAGDQGGIGDNEDFEVLQHTSPGVVSAGQGDDTYIVSSSTLDGGEEITVQDGQGANSLQLVEGLEIAGSTVAINALQLTLANGAVINVNGADQFTYEPGGNTVAGVNGPDVSFDAFVTDTLGIVGGVPTSGTAQGDPIII